MAALKGQRAIEVLARNRQDLIRLVQTKGETATTKMLAEAERDLVKRLKAVDTLGAGADSFTATQLRATLAQVREVTKSLSSKVKDQVVTRGVEAAEGSTKNTAEYLMKLDAIHRAAGVQPLALNEARMFERATFGVRSSVLNRLASTKNAARQGVMQRYGVETIKNFESTLQQGLVQRKTWAEMKEDITKRSPFLQGAPAHWAKRIVRTEIMGAYNRAGWEALREADDQLGDMVKILSATFDDRTGADSYAVHGQIRRPDEAFEWWDGLYQHPPNRPNDREVVTPHRISWPIPKYLEWRDDAEVIEAWVREKRKGKPPPRPLMTTVPLDRFGKEQPKPKEKEEPEEEVEDEDTSEAEPTES